MRARFRLAWVLAALLLPATAVSDPTGTYPYVVPFGGFTVFDGTLRVPTTTLRDQYYAGGRLGLQWRPWLGIEVAGGYTPTEEDRTNGGDVTYWHASGNLLWSPFDGLFGEPFLSVGGGMAKLSPDGGSEIDQGNLEVGGGLNFWLTDGLGLRLEARDIMWIDNDDTTDDLVRTHTMVVGAGLTFPLGATPRDTDGDGVPDRRDECPDTPHGATVDARGCPGDDDGDGVLNGIDQCPNTMTGATVDTRGCPSDSDGDGVFDGIDQCADTPAGATVDAKGCPGDDDGAGVLNGIDQCPGTPAGATVDAKGCPSDADGDGVFDGIDKCPDTTPGLKVDASGCPIEVIERETELLDTGMIRLDDVNFETAKAELLPESLPSINVVGQLLSKWPELKIEVGGHTDSRGDAGYNQRLSEARAKAVLDYLLATFPDLDESQFSSKGYGERKPIASNDTDDGMARNRRVEFVVLNKDVLRKESTNRRFLREGDAPADSTAPDSGAMPDSGAAPGTPDGGGTPDGSGTPGGGTTPGGTPGSDAGGGAVAPSTPAQPDSTR